MRKASYLAAAGIFAAGFLLHFVYEWSGGSALVGAVCPVNESVWEHLKLPFFPLVIWWFAYGWKTGLPVKHRTIAAAVSAGTACLTVILIHYAVSGVLGFDVMAADIASLGAGLFAGQYLALMMLDRPHGKPAWAISAAVLAALGGLLILFTFCPPRIPLFLDKESGTYGIQR